MLRIFDWRLSPPIFGYQEQFYRIHKVGQFVEGQLSRVAHARVSDGKLENIRLMFSSLSRQIQNGVEQWRTWRERTNSGRKRKFEDQAEYKKAWSRNHKRIYLENRIFRSWLQPKFNAGYEASSDSDFVAHLRFLEITALIECKIDANYFHSPANPSLRPI